MCSTFAVAVQGFFNLRADLIGYANILIGFNQEKVYIENLICIIIRSSNLPLININAMSRLLFSSVDYKAIIT